MVRELLLGPKRFTDLKKGLPNASPNVISERLRELEHAGVIRRDKLPPPAGSRVYRLTDWGRGLEDVVDAQPGDAPIGADSTVLALKERFDPDAARGLRASYELRLGEDRFRIEVSNEQIEVARGSADRPDATIDTDPGTLAAVLWDGRPLADAQMSIVGDQAAVERLVRLFPKPEPVAA